MVTSLVVQASREVFGADKDQLKGKTKDELLAIIEREARGPESKRVLRESLDYESPAHLYFSVFPCPPVITKAKGALVWDIDGNEYIDFIGGWSVHNIGHSRPEVIEAIKAQCEVLIQYAEMPHELRTKLAKKLVEISPINGRKKVYFGVTGGEAVEASMKFARYYTGRPTIIGFYGGYHGRTFGAMTVTSDAYMRSYQGFPLDIGVVHVPYAYCYRCLFGKEYPECGMQCTKHIEELLKSHQYGLRHVTPKGGVTNVAALLVEPMQAHSGYITPPPEFLRNLRRIADEYDLLLIDDEVQAGWGRTGKWWGCQHSEVIPDIMPTAKSIAGGIPMSVTITKSDIMDDLGPAAHATTFGGTPLACAVALAVINVFEKERIVERAAVQGEYLMKGLRDLEQRHRIIGNITGKGLFIGVELVKDRKTKEPATEENIVVQKECLRKGLIYPRQGRFGNMINTICPLTIERDQIDRALEIFDNAFTVAEKNLP